jgi:hypothetical protein
LAVFLSVLSSLMVGVVLFVAPWTILWDSNYLLAPYPAVRAVVLNAWVRGTISGLGLVNIALAIHEARQRLARER